jgi:hypothetical protein
MPNIRKLCNGTGYAIEDSPHDTTNIICRHGRIYADGDYLVASMDCATPTQSKALRQLGESVMDGDFGELSVKFKTDRLREVARILKPHQQEFLDSEKTVFGEHVFATPLG